MIFLVKLPKWRLLRRRKKINTSTGKQADENQPERLPEFPGCGGGHICDHASSFRGTPHVATTQAFRPVPPGKYALLAFPGRSRGGAMAGGAFFLLRSCSSESL